jgi:sporulation protein YlmC with PRC-barrel domain
LWGTAQAQSPARDDARSSGANEYSASLSHEEYLEGRDLRATELVGAQVRNTEGEQLGEIEELVIGSDDVDEMVVVLSVGGFAGIGEKRVAIPYEELRVSPDGSTFYVNRTKDALAAAPVYSYEGRAEPQSRQATATQRDLDDQNRARATQPRTTATAQAHDRADRAGETNARNDTAGAREDAAEADVRQETTIPRERTAARSAAQDASTLGTDDHRASNIIGATVVDSFGETVGEVDDLVLSVEDDEIHAVLSIGGIAGVGEKLVAVPFDDLQIAPSASDADSAARLRLDMTAEQLLDALPEFRYERQVAQGDAANPRG